MHVYIFLSSFTKSLPFFARDLVRKENIILNISIRDFHDFVENSDLDFFVCFSFTRPHLTLCICCYTSNESQVVNIIHFGAIFSQLFTK